MNLAASIISTESILRLRVLGLLDKECQTWYGLLSPFHVAHSTCPNSRVCTGKIALQSIEDSYWIQLRSFCAVFRECLHPVYVAVESK